MDEPSALQDAITRMVRVMLALNTAHQKDLADAMGLHASNVTRRMKHGGWTIEDLDAMARYFNVPIATFFEDPRALFDQQRLPSAWNDECTEFAEVTGG
jgi:hypothetical protein